ncbi:MAG: ATP synthase F0 subunit C [Proteobacteria bacterium]|nr:ATP synthase F0 subunit C [Pseudomonadota bacterium]
MDIQSWIRVSSVVGAGVSMGFGAIGSAVGEGYAAGCANEAMSRRPDMYNDIARTMLLGQAVAESAAIFSLLIAMLLLFTGGSSTSPLAPFGLIAAGICMGIGAIGSGIGSGLPAGAATIGIARQPASKSQITTTMLIGAAITQTSAIYSLVTSFLLIFMDYSARPFAPFWAALLGAGISTGIAAIGSGVGEGFVAQTGVESVARNPTAMSRVVNVMMLSMAVAETTSIYGLLIAMILLFKTYPATASLASAAALLGAGICMGIGAIGPGIGEGLTGQQAIRWIGRNEEATPIITRTMLVGQAVSESTGIYSLVIAFIMIFVV